MKKIGFEKDLTEATVARMKKEVHIKLMKRVVPKLNVIGHSFDCEVRDIFIYSISYVITDAKFFNHLYSMNVKSIYDGDIYENANVISSKKYNLEDVKAQCKNHYENTYNRILASLSEEEL